MKTKFFSVPLILFLIAGTSSNSQNLPSEYYRVINKDSLYVFSSDTHILFFSSPSEEGNFTFLSAIPGHYTPETIITLNDEYFLVENNDSLSLYNIDDLCCPNLIYSQNFEFEIDDVIGFGPHFSIRVGNYYKLISPGNNSFEIIEDTVFTPWSMQALPSFKYPYVIIRTSIYKYIESFGLYLLFITNDYSVDLQFTYDSIIEYYYFYSNGFPNPPSWGIIGRSLEEPDFPILFTWHYWPHWDFNGLRDYIAMTEKYIYGIDLAYNENIYLQAYAGTIVYTHTSPDYSVKITDNHIFQLGENILYSNPVNPGNFFVLNYNIVSTKREETTLLKYTLYDNYPNPFNSSTVIKYTISQPSRVYLIVLNILGQEVALLVSEEKPAGTYEVTFDAKLPSGIYLYRLQTRSFSETKKMILMK